MLRAVITLMGQARWKTALWVALSVSAAVIVPAVALGILVANAVALVVHLALHAFAVFASRTPSTMPTPDGVARHPFVSIHLPICSEPPDLVKATLDSLAAMTYPSFEVIVLDNNTSDPVLWEPVRLHCLELGPRFTFEHVEHLSGAKAGALNRCLDMTDRRAELIAVVDADYQPTPGWLESAIAAMGTTAYVQFPQAYRDTAGREGLEWDYAHYFQTHMQLADKLRAPLLTGTMCVIRESALRSVGGWSPRTITEDAELGLRMVEAGFEGRYVHRVAGRGVMPMALQPLKSQRRRWVHGNAQTLLGLRWTTLRRLGVRRSVAVIAQLTAWFNFLLIPVGAVLAFSVLPHHTTMHRWALHLAAASIWAHLALGSILRVLVPCDRIAAADHVAAWKPLRAHLALAWIGAVAWLEPLLGVALSFCKTDKSGTRDRDALVDVGMVLAVASAVAALVYATREDIVGVAGALGVAVVASSLCSLRGSLRRSVPTKECIGHVAPAL